MLIRVNPSTDRAIYLQIADAVRAEIAAGHLTAGTTLPAAKDIAASLEVNPHTVLHAYQLLRDEGLVDLRRGRGAVVTPLATAMRTLHSDALALARSAHKLGLDGAALAATLQHATENVAAEHAAAVPRDPHPPAATPKGSLA